MKKPNMAKIEQIEHFQTHIHRFSLLMPIGDSHHHTLYIMYASRFKSPKKEGLSWPFSGNCVQILKLVPEGTQISRGWSPECAPPPHLKRKHNVRALSQLRKQFAGPPSKHGPRYPTKRHVPKSLATLQWIAY